MQLAQPLKLMKAGGVVGVILAPVIRESGYCSSTAATVWGPATFCPESGKQLAVQLNLRVVVANPAACVAGSILSCFSYSSGSVYSHDG